MRVLVWRSTCIHIRGALRFQYMSSWTNDLCVNALVYASVFHHVLMCLCRCCICVHCDSPCEHLTYPLTTGKGKVWAEGRRGRVREATGPPGNQHCCFHVRIDFNNSRVKFWNNHFIQMETSCLQINTSIAEHTFTFWKHAFVCDGCLSFVITLSANIWFIW